MSQSTMQIPVHLVFSTKNRIPLITPQIDAELCRCLAGIFATYRCPPILIGTADDHVHILFNAPKMITVPALIEQVKKGSSKWIKTKGPQFSGFYWQNGYGAFGAGEDCSQLKQYIQGQREHHRRQSFQDEYREFLRRRGIPFDERYMWD